MLGCAAGRTCTEVAREQKTSSQTVSKWRQRFVDLRLDGMADTPHPNVHHKLADDRVEELVRATLQELPKGSTHWSNHKLAQARWRKPVLGVASVACLSYQAASTTHLPRAARRRAR